MRAAFVSIGPGTAGTRDTLAVMRRVVRDEYAHPAVRRRALQLARGARTWSGLADRLRRWLATHTEFVRDPRGLEWVLSPLVQLKSIAARGVVAGDCDDVAVLAAALGLALGFRARFVTLGNGQQYVHVFTEVSPNGEDWREMDVTRPMQGIPPELLRVPLTVEV